MAWRIEPARPLQRLLLSLSIVAAAGCADSGKAKVDGMVTVGGVPVVQGTIGFFPADGEGPSAEAVIEDGAYSITMIPGKKTVVIHGFQQVGEKFPWGRGGQAMPVLEEIVPVEFHADSQLTADVVGNQAGLDFEL